MKFTIEVDSNFNINVEAFVEVMNREVLTDKDFIVGMSEKSAIFGDEVVTCRHKTNSEN